MSSSNELEIISRGSIRMLTPEHSSEHEISTTDVKMDRHVTLEPLPPQRPQYPSHCEPSVGDQQEEGEELPLMEDETIPLCLERATHELAQSRLQTENLLQRIEELSGRIRSGLSLVEKTGATVPSLPVSITGADDGSEVIITTSALSEYTQFEGEVPNCGKTVTEACNGGPDEIEGGGERGVVSQEGGDVDPKLVKALEKMRRLDKRLADLVTREREVKEQRRQFELQIAGVDPLTTEEGGPPVFQTQVPDYSTDPLSSEHGTDFIQRNIEESGAVVLSESERLRLEELLADDNDHAEEMPDGGSAASVNNCFKLSAKSQAALSHIDIQLQAMGSCGGTVEESPSEWQQPLSAGQETQRLREIDEELAALKTSSPQSQVRPNYTSALTL